MNTNYVCSRENKLIAPLISLSEELQKTDCSILLDTVETIALNALDGLTAFQENKLNQLDPNVGDESCQIRALMVLQWAHQKIGAEVDSGKQELQNLCKKIQEIRIQWRVVEKELKTLKEETDKIFQSYAQQKKRINLERDEQLSKVKKGTDESKQIWEEFKKKMEVISAQESPIRQKLASQEKEILCSKAKIMSETNLEVNLSKTNRQIILCYILNKIISKQFENHGDRCTYRVGVNLKNLQVAGLTYQAPLLEAIVAKAKSIINSESMEFLVDESKKIVGKRSKVIQLAMQTPLVSAKKGFKEYSFYHGCEVIIKRLQQMGLPILIKSRALNEAPDKFSCEQLFLPLGKNKKYIASTENPKNIPVLIIEGVSQNALNKGLSSMIDEAGGLMKLVRLNLAQHRFCTSQTSADANILKRISAEMDQEIERLDQEKQQALTLGYSQMNPSNFMIDHIYADLLVTQDQ